MTDTDIPIVDVPGSNAEDRLSSSPNHHTGESHSDDENEETLSDDTGEEDLDEDEGSYVSPRSGQSSPNHVRGKTRTRRLKGRRGINMTPPDKLLDRAQKRATKHSSENESNKGVHERTRCIALAQIVYGSNHWKVAQAHTNLATTYLHMKAYHVQAQYHCENAKAIMMNAVHTSSSEHQKAEIYTVLINIFHTLGQALMHLKKYAEAAQCLTKADQVAGQRSKLACVTMTECDKTDIKLSLALSRLFAKQKKYAVAQAQYEKCLELTRSSYGDNSLHLVPVYQEMGKLEQTKGRHANHNRAIEMHLQAHYITTAIYKQDSIEAADTSLTLARAYAMVGKEEAERSAETYLNDCLASCTVRYGPHHIKTLEVQDELARLHVRTDRHSDALSLLKSSLDQKSEAYGEYSEQVSDTYKLMASIYLAQGEIEKALRMYKKCHNIESLVLGVNHKKSKDTQRNMDILMSTSSVSNKFVLSKEDELKKRPRFNAIVSRSQPVGGL